MASYQALLRRRMAEERLARVKAHAIETGFVECKGCSDTFRFSLLYNRHGGLDGYCYECEDLAIMEREACRV